MTHGTCTVTGNLVRQHRWRFTWIGELEPILATIVDELTDLPGCKRYQEGAQSGYLELPVSVWNFYSAQILMNEVGWPKYGWFTSDWFKPKDRTLYTHQVEAVRFLLQHEGGLLADDMGLGKLQPVDTNVLTPDGWRQIGSLAVGDYVLGSDGQRTRVRSVFPQGVKPSYRVSFSDGASVEAGAEHLWTLAYRSDGRNWAELVVPTEALLRNETVGHRRTDGGTARRNLTKTKLYLPMLSQPADFSSPGVPLHGYLLGQLIANGSLAHGTPKLVTGVRDWVHVKQRLCNRLHETQLSVPRSYGSTVHVNVLDICSTIRDLSLDVLSAKKRIPEVYQRAAEITRVALLHGLMDADGSISKTRCKVTYHTISRGLAEDVVELVEGLGGIASIRTYDRTHEDKPVEYQVRIRTPLTIPPFSLPRKLVRWQPGSHAAPKRVFVSAEYVRDVESVCIEVEAEDNLYVTEHAILTHNTTSAIVAAETYAARYAPSRPRLVVGPGFTRDIWRRELIKTGAIEHEDELVILTTTKPDDRLSDPTSFKWIFVHYDVVYHWPNKLWTMYDMRPICCIVDESHRVKNPKAKRSKGTLNAALPCPFRVLLTGTPMENRPSELWHQLSIVDGKRNWGNQLDFRVRYCAAMHNGFGYQDYGVSRHEELKKRLETRMLRRTKAEVAADLPVLTRNSITSSMTEAAQKQHEKGLAKLEKVCGTVEQIVDNFLKGITPSDETLRLLGVLRKISSKAKLKTTVEYISELLEQSESVIVFCWQREMAESIMRALDRTSQIPYGQVIHGGIEQELRDCWIKEFQEDTRREPSYIVATYGALSEGVTLTAARIVVLHDLDWTPATILQAEARIHRIGQKNACQSVWMIAENSIDVLFTRILNQKARTMEQLGLVEMSEALVDVGLDIDLAVEGAQKYLASWETMQ